MVSFTSEGGPQTLDLGAISQLEERQLDLNMSLNESDNLVGGVHFTSRAGTGSKRGPQLPGIEKGLPLKRVKLAEANEGGKISPGDAQLASTVFKKFVNSALDEKAMVGAVYCPRSNQKQSRLTFRPTIGELPSLPGATEEIHCTTIG